MQMVIRKDVVSKCRLISLPNQIEDIRAGSIKEESIQYIRDNTANN